MREKPRRYERENVGELVHIDVKKLPKIPEGGGWAVHGRGSTKAKAANRSKPRPGSRPNGYVYLHNAIDDAGRVAYSEWHTDQKATTAADFFERLQEYYLQELGAVIEGVMTDNGSCYRSKIFSAALGEVHHVYTRPYRPQTNGKVERFNRTLIQEWHSRHAFSSETERQTSYTQWVNHYNHHRSRTALKGLTPMQHIHNLPKPYN